MKFIMLEAIHTDALQDILWKFTEIKRSVSTQSKDP